MGVSIHKVAKEKLHKHGFTHIQNKLRHCPASQTVACSNTWSQLAFPQFLPDFYEFFFLVLHHTVVFITAPYGLR